MFAVNVSELDVDALWLSSNVGFMETLQQNPLSVIVCPPLEVIEALQVAALCVMLLMLPVLISTSAYDVVKVVSLPYDVPTELIAYALT